MHTTSQLITSDVLVNDTRNSEGKESCNLNNWKKNCEAEKHYHQ